MKISAELSLKLCLLTWLLSLNGCSYIGGADGAKQSATKIGVVELIKGAPRVLRGTDMILLRRGSRLRVRDTIFTGPDDKIRLKMIDDTRIALGNDSQFVFHVYSYRNPAPIARMSFSEGSFRATTGKFMQRDGASFEIATPVALIGVRGTDFWGGFIFGDNTLDVAMLSGDGIYVKNEFGTVEIDEAGVGTTVTFGVAPAKPERWTAVKAISAIEATSI